MESLVQLMNISGSLILFTALVIMFFVQYRIQKLAKYAIDRENIDLVILSKLDMLYKIIDIASYWILFGGALVLIFHLFDVFLL